VAPCHPRFEKGTFHNEFLHRAPNTLSFLGRRRKARYCSWVVDVTRKQTHRRNRPWPSLPLSFFNDFRSLPVGAGRPHGRSHRVPGTPGLRQKKRGKGNEKTERKETRKRKGKRKRGLQRAPAGGELTAAEGNNKLRRDSSIFCGITGQAGQLRRRLLIF